MKLIAHRGLKINGAKENSLEAFQNAIDSPLFVGFELDVRTSKDGKFVVHHNLLIDKEMIRFLNYDVLKQKYQISLLEDVLKLKTQKVILIEIKEANLNVDAFITLIERYKNKNLYFDSFDNQVIQKLLKKTTFFHFGVLNYVINSETNYSEYDFIGLLAPVVTEKLLNYFRGRNKEIFLYGITKQKEIGKYDDVYYITDEIF